MFLRVMIFIVATIIILFWISWKLTLVTLGGILPVFIVAKYYGDRIKIISKEVQDQKAFMGTVCEESISNIRTVKAFSTEKFEAVRHAKANDECYKLGLKLAMLNGIFSFFA